MGHRLHDEEAEAAAGEEPFGHNRANDAAGEGDFVGSDVVGQRAGPTYFAENLPLVGIERLHTIQQYRIRRLQPLGHIGQDGEEGDQHHDDDLGRGRVSQGDDEDGGDGDKRNVLDHHCPRHRERFEPGNVEKGDRERNGDEVGNGVAGERFDNGRPRMREEEFTLGPQHLAHHVGRRQQKGGEAAETRQQHPQYGDRDEHDQVGHAFRKDKAWLWHGLCPWVAAFDGAVEGLSHLSHLV